MVISRRLSLVVTLALLALTLTAAVVLSNAGGVGAAPKDRPAQTEATSVAESLVGTWVGMKSGAERGRFEQREWRVVFRRSQENAAFGTKQYQQPNGRFSPREVVNAVVDSTGHIWAADEDGVLNGSLLDDGTLELIYQEAGTDDGAAVIAILERQE
jgi:hypothetical protein